ncbi:MAG TPA: A/G-specific adenine glycosylase [Thermoanaerobaculia bacterium]
MQSPHLSRLVRKIESWFLRYQRPLPWRHSYDPYHVWVSEVMLQQTRMEVVLPYFERFIARFPSLSSLAAASEQEVLACWSGLGYYRRARMLHQGAQTVIATGGTVPAGIEALMKLPGIGRYTAGAIASIAWNRKAPIVDGNIARIASRLFGIEESAGSARLMKEAWTVATRLVEACKEPRLFNQGLMELGALICRPRDPLCSRCPLTAECNAKQTGRQTLLPLPREVKSTYQMRVPLYLISDDRGRILMRRETGALMQSMYHLPHGVDFLFAAAPLAAEVHEELGSFRHSITDRRVSFVVQRAGLRGRIRDGIEEYEWIEPSSLADIPHPSYVAKALRLWSRSVSGARSADGSR